MDDRIQYKMFNLEVAPPENAWDNIESLLNNQQEISLIQRFKEFEVTPPPGAWPFIKAELDQAIAPPARVISFNVRRLAAAAVIIGIITTVAWLVTGSNKDYVVPAGAATASLVLPSPPPAKPFEPTNPKASPAAKVERISVPAPVINLSRKSTTFNEPVPIAAVRRVQPVDPAKPNTSRIAVNAPLILGSDGKPYIDYQLLSSADKKYVTITSPNGEQTRISSKFLPVLAYLNDHGSTAAEAVEWITRFQQWKKRLLEDPDFIPAAGNFLDLPELTDVFEEQ